MERERAEADEKCKKAIEKLEVDKELGLVERGKLEEENERLRHELTSLEEASKEH